MSRCSFRIPVWVLFTVTIGLYCPAAAEMDSPESRDQILAHIDSLHVSRQVDATAAYIKPHLAEARASEDSTFILPLVAKLGRLWASFGQPKKGEPLLREATGLAKALEDSLLLCDALRWLGYAVEQQGRSDEAVMIYRRQRAIALARQDHRHEAWALVGLAYRGGQEGRYSEAVDDYRVAVGLFQSLSDTAAAVWTLNGLGAVLELSGQFKEAAITYGEVSDLARRIGYKAVEALAQNNRGALEYSLGDPGVALDRFRRTRQLQLQISQLQDAVSSGANEANCLMHLGRLDEAVVLLNILLEDCEKGNFLDRESYVLRVLADVRRKQGRRHEAVEIYRRILVRDDASLDLRNRIESLVGYTKTLAEMDSSLVALEALQREEQLRGDRLRGTTRVEFELSFAARLTETGQHEAALARYRFAVGATTEAGLMKHRVVALAGAAGCLRELGRTDEALTLLQEAAVAWEDTRGVPLDPEWREQRGASGRLVYTQLAALILAGAGTDSSAVVKAFEKVQIFKARTLAERMGGRSRMVGRSTTTLRLLQEKTLKDGEIFLDAYLGPRESILFAVTTTECLAVLLPDERTLAKRFRLFHEMLATPPQEKNRDLALEVVETAGARLGHELLGSIAPLLSDSRRVICAPDGPLNLVPLAAVAPGRDREPRPVWTRVPSATILEYLRYRGRRASYSGRGILAAAASETPGGQPLPGAMWEVRYLAGQYREVDLRVAGMTGGRLAPRDLARYDILHLATHARVDDQHPWSSEIILDTRGPSGRIQAGRISKLHLKARLAVLSACETGSGRILSGEGVLGLSSAFLSSGVPTVVASLWPVADGVTAALMKEFYRELDAGHDPSTALARAQDLIRAEPLTAHPFHWAGFVVIGDGTVKVDLEARHQRGTVAGFVLASAVIIVLGLAVRKRLRPVPAE